MMTSVGSDDDQDDEDTTAMSINARRTESHDSEAILKLVTPATSALFGRVNIFDLIEKATLAITLCNESDEILGHGAFVDYPAPDIDPDLDVRDWPAWFLSREFVNLPTQVTPLNALFMRFFVSKSDYSRGCAAEIIRTAFNALPHLHYCLLVVPDEAQLDTALAEIFHPLKCAAQYTTSNTDRSAEFEIYICDRIDHSPTLHIRDARVEDNDLLVPILRRYSNVLGIKYGDYFLAELIEAQNENMRCIVAEVEGVPVGFMSLSESVNVSLLDEYFELAPFSNLRVPTKGDEDFTADVPDEEEDESEEEDDDEFSLHEDGDRESLRSAMSARPQSAKDRDVSLMTLVSNLMIPNRSSAASAAINNVEHPRDTVTYSEAAIARRTSDPVFESPFLQSDIERGRLSVKRPSYRSSDRSSGIDRELHRHRGDSSAFCIQLFCIDERYEMRSCDFLPTAFQLFPGRKFCVITVPHLVPKFPLLQQFVRVMPRPFDISENSSQTPYPSSSSSRPSASHSSSSSSSSSARVTRRNQSILAHELYLFHVSGLIPDFRVRLANTGDTGPVERLVETLMYGNYIMKDLIQYNRARRDEDGTALQAFVAEVRGQIVGIAIIRTEENIEYIRAHYNIEDFIYFNHHRRQEHAHLHHFVLNPIFKHYTQIFIKEMFRVGEKTCLYYPVYPIFSDQSKTHNHSTVTCLAQLVPVRARRQIIYPNKSGGSDEINLPSTRIMQEQEPYALYHINRKLALEPKVTINARIVVVGASDVGIAFLESFVFCPHLTFNNLVLISTHGLPGERDTKDIVQQMRAQSLCYTMRDYANLGLRVSVNVVEGKMTGIDRKKKFVKVNGDKIVPYDHLILCTGTQYHAPMPTMADIDSGATNSDLPNPHTRPYVGQPPQNLFVVNDDRDAAKALEWVAIHLLGNKEKVIVYGNSLDAYCCVQALVNNGLRGHQIIFVQPPLNGKISCFNNQHLETAVGHGLIDAGIKVFKDCILARFNDGQPSPQNITSASFTTPTATSHNIACTAMFSFVNIRVDEDAFRAVNCASLVFDGRLVIDADFHTNDPCIRAAGGLTKYKRIYYAGDWTHANYNSKEIGQSLAASMMKHFDPSYRPPPPDPHTTESDARELRLLPKYTRPKVQYGWIGGSYYYLLATKPAIPELLEKKRESREYGRDITTGEPGGHPEYFCIHVNQFNSVETITCLSRTELPWSNILCLFGKYFHRVQDRYEQGLVPDLYLGIQEDWTMALFHDRYDDLTQDMRATLLDNNDGEISLEQLARSMLEDDEPHLSSAQKQVLFGTYNARGYRSDMQLRMLSFLNYNYYHLPMYARPGMI